MGELVLLVVIEILTDLLTIPFVGAVDVVGKALSRPPARCGISPIWLFLGIVGLGLLFLLYLHGAGSVGS
jgi:hypothetical protein